MEFVSAVRVDFSKKKSQKNFLNAFLEFSRVLKTDDIASFRNSNIFRAKNRIGYWAQINQGVLGLSDHYWVLDVDLQIGKDRRQRGLPSQHRENPHKIGQILMKIV